MAREPHYIGRAVGFKPGKMIFEHVEGMYPEAEDTDIIRLIRKAPD